MPTEWAGSTDDPENPPHADDTGDFENAEDEPLNPHSEVLPLPTRSHYALTRSEISKGIANRFVHSRAYVFLYLGMAALSVTTVVLSLTDGCPGKAFYILEFIINGAMIIEVTLRFIAFGQRFWSSPFNVIDLCLTFLCILTLIVLLFARCGSTSKEEELLDTLLLVARNVLQFGRLAAVMQRSGRSIFAAPKPIDLSVAGRGSRLDDIDLPGEGVGLVGDAPWDDVHELVFDAETPSPSPAPGRVGR